MRIMSTRRGDAQGAAPPGSLARTTGRPSALLPILLRPRVFAQAAPRQHLHDAHRTERLADRARTALGVVTGQPRLNGRERLGQLALHAPEPVESALRLLDVP